MYLKIYIYLIICLVFIVLYLIIDIIMIVLILVFFIKWFNRWIYMLENGIVWFENLINLFIWLCEKFIILKKIMLYGDCIIMKFLK